MQNAAPQYGADQCIRPGGSYFHQQLAVIQQKLLPGAGCLYQLDRAGDAACTQLYRAALRQDDRAGQPPDTQFRPLQVDEQVRNADSVDHCQPVSVFGQRPVGKVHAQAGHAGVHKAAQSSGTGAGRADGSIKMHKGPFFHRLRRCSCKKLHKSRTQGCSACSGCKKAAQMGGMPSSATS